MPAEWEPHAATWIAWPHNRDDWPGKFAPIPWVYTEIVRHLSRVERVHIVVRGGAMKRRVADQLDAVGVDLEAVRFFKAATDRVWLRDSGPTFVVKDEPAADGRSTASAWSTGSSTAGPSTTTTATTTASRASSRGGWVCRAGCRGSSRAGRRGPGRDGGGRDRRQRPRHAADDRGMPARRGPGPQPRPRPRGIEQVFADYLGVRHVVWLGRGIDGDDTHGHVDDLARFVDPRTVVTVVEPRADDPNHEPLQENLRRLQAARDQDGQPLRVVELPMPRPVVFEGQRLPASYANFYIANGLVLVPTFNDPADRVALDTLASLFPDREVVGIHSVDLVLGLGTLHCLSQQQPAGPQPDFAER